MQAVDLTQENKDLSCSEKEQDIILESLRIVDDGKKNTSSGDSTPPPRNGWKPPQYVLQQEKFEHRIIAHLKAEGRTNTEIAEMTGLSLTTINYIVKQPWVEPLVLEIIHKKGGDKVEIFLNELVMPALETFKETLDDPTASKRDKITVANSILDRKYGKPNQPMSVVHSKQDPSQLTDDELRDIAKRGRVAPSPTTTG